MSDVRMNWQALLFWCLVLSSSALAIWYGQILEDREIQEVEHVQDTFRDLEIRVTETAALSRRIFEGDDQAFASLAESGSRVGEMISSLDSLGLDRFDEENRIDQLAMDDVWVRLEPMILLMTELAPVGNVISTLPPTVDRINDVTPQLSGQVDALVEDLLETGSSPQLVDLGRRLQVQLQRIPTYANAFLAGKADALQATRGIQDGVRQYKRIYSTMWGLAGSELAVELISLNLMYQQLYPEILAFLSRVRNFETILGAARKIDLLSMSMLENVREVRTRIDAGLDRPAWAAGIPQSGNLAWLRNDLPWVIGFITVLAIVGLVLTVSLYLQRRKSKTDIDRGILLGSLNRLLMDLRRNGSGEVSATAGSGREKSYAMAESFSRDMEEIRLLVSDVIAVSKKLSSVIGELRPHVGSLVEGNREWSEELVRVDQEIAGISGSMKALGDQAFRTTEHVGAIRESSGKGGREVDQVMSSMGEVKSRMEEAEDSLKRFGRSTRKLSEIVGLVQDVTEQANVLALNASIQASMAGDADKGYFVLSDQANRLAVSFSNASSGFTEVAQSLQKDAEEAVRLMESTSTEIGTGVESLSRIHQVQNELERNVESLLTITKPLAQGADDGGEQVKKLSVGMRQMCRQAEDMERMVKQVDAHIGQIIGALDDLNQTVGSFRQSG